MQKSSASCSGGGSSGSSGQMAPYAVAELRLHEALGVRFGTDIPAADMRFLTNTLDNPYRDPLPPTAAYKVIEQSFEEANRIKREERVLVAIGNPPHVGDAKRQGAWLVGEGKATARDRPGSPAVNRRLPHPQRRQVRVGPPRHAVVLPALGPVEGLRRPSRSPDGRRRPAAPGELHRRPGIRGYQGVPPPHLRRRLDHRPVARRQQVRQPEPGSSARKSCAACASPSSHGGARRTVTRPPCSTT